MKKIIALIFLSIFIKADIMPVYAINIGTYKTETEYGLLDGFKINWKRKDKSQKFIEPREESTNEEKTNHCCIQRHSRNGSEARQDEP